MEFIKDILVFIFQRKKWWLAPVLLALLLISIFVFFAESPVAPFIYSLF